MRFMVDGFRSLIDFQCTINSGLNVLVGPNGAGKTNFLDFLSFVDDFMNFDLIHAIRKAGGSNAVFSRERSSAGNKIREFSFSVNSICSVNETYYTNRRIGYMRYFYEVTACLDTEKSLLFLSKERVSFSPLFRSKANKPRNIPELHYVIEGTRDSKTPEDLNVKITTLTDRIQKKSTQSYPSIAQMRSTLERSKKHILPHESMLEYAFWHKNFFLHGIKFDLSVGRKLNIRPQQAKANDDLASGTGLQSDGSGLIATLYAMKNQYVDFGRGRYFPRRRGESKGEQIDEVSKYLNMINPSLGSIKVEPNFEVGQYVGTVSVVDPYNDFGNEDNLSLPFSSISDGTAKWIALITCLVTRMPLSSIEEPENFLHPSMQTELLDIVRYFYPKVYLGRPILVSTHSETVLNAAKPSEILLAEYLDGKTSVRRLENVDSINESIRESGFGLGQLYVTDAI